MVPRQRKDHERPEQILLSMFVLSEGTTDFLKYEDIVVKAFRMFPDEFALRGYPEFPDSSDVHKPLYGVLKRKGLIRSANKNFGLTALGVETARAMAGKNDGEEPAQRPADRMPRDVQSEVDRMLKSAAVKFFVSGEPHRVLDTDFYSFIGCTVRTPRNDFVGRMSAIDNAVATAKKLRQPDKGLSTALAETWDFLRRTFSTLIERRRGTK